MGSTAVSPEELLVKRSSVQGELNSDLVLQVFVASMPSNLFVEFKN